MELVDFMRNRTSVVENMKENGIITDGEKVTYKGLMAIQFYLDMKDRSEKAESGELKLEYVETADMGCEELKKWEEEHQSASVDFDAGGVLEFMPVEMFSSNDNIRVKGTGTKAMSISMCDCCCEHEISEIVSTKEELVKLRDCLNKYLEN